MARLLTGREAASALTEELKGRTASLARQGVTPKLVILRCGESEADGAYLRGALKRGALCGVEVEVRTLPDTASRQQLLDAIDAVNADSTVHGCLLLRPLPPHLRDAEPEICDRLLPEKEWLEGTMDLWVRFDNGVVIGLYQDANYGYIGTELDVIGEGPFYSFPEKFYDLAFQAKEQQSAAQ